MTFRPFTIPAAKGKSFKTIGAIDVAAKYLVYKPYEATDGQPMRWAMLRGMGELRATVERAVERGWVILEVTSGKPLDRKAALTDEGRRRRARGDRRLESRLDPIERLTELEKDCTQAKGDIREILDRLAEKHGATVRDVTAAMLSIDDTLSDLLYDQERMLQHEIEDLTPV